MKCSDLFVKCLETEGIDIIFGVPGEENADFVMSLEQSSKIRFVLTRHEQGAAFMAEVWGRLSGQPALGTVVRHDGGLRRNPIGESLLEGRCNAPVKLAPTGFEL